MTWQVTLTMPSADPFFAVATAVEELLNDHRIHYERHDVFTIIEFTLRFEAQDVAQRVAHALHNVTRREVLFDCVAVLSVEPERA